MAEWICIYVSPHHHTIKSLIKHIPFCLLCPQKVIKKIKETPRNLKIWNKTVTFTSAFTLSWYITRYINQPPPPKKKEIRFKRVKKNVLKLLLESMNMMNVLLEILYTMWTTILQRHQRIKMQSADLHFGWPPIHHL